MDYECDHGVSIKVKCEKCDKEILEDIEDWGQPDEYGMEDIVYENEE